MPPRLSAATLAQLKADVRRPDFDRSGISIGLLRERGAAAVIRKINEEETG
jgi:hypothetical protein